MLDQEVRRWTVSDASEMYDIARWGKGYFSIGEEGQKWAWKSNTGFQGERLLIDYVSVTRHGACWRRGFRYSDQ